MNKEQERLLDYLLELEHGEPEPPTDMAGSVARAWAAGERGSLRASELSRLESELEVPARDERAAPTPLPAPRAVGSSRRLRSRLWIGVAAAVVVAFGIRAAFPPADPDERFSADPSVLVLSGASQVARTSATVRTGDAVVVLEHAVSLTSHDGVQLHAQVPSLLAFPDADASAEVLFGDVAVQTRERPLEVRFGFATLSVFPDTSLSFEALRANGGSVTLAAARRALIDGLDEPRSVRVRVTAGEAELRSRGILERVVPSSGTVSVSSRRAPAVPDATLERFDALTAFMLRGAPLVEPGATTGTLMRELGELLARYESLRASFRERVVDARAAGTVTRLATSYALDFLQVDPSPQAVELASTIWREEPSSLTHGHIVTFAERGAFEFEREAEAMVRAWNDDPGGTSPAPVLPAVFLALRGDESGRQLLEASSIPPDVGVAPGWPAFEFLLASWALEHLGVEDAWPDAVAALGETASMNLLRGELVEARRIVLALEIVVELRDAAEPRLGLALRDSFDEPSRRADELGSAEEVDALLRKLER